MTIAFATAAVGLVPQAIRKHSAGAYNHVEDTNPFWCDVESCGSADTSEGGVASTPNASGTSGCAELDVEATAEVVRGDLVALDVAGHIEDELFGVVGTRRSVWIARYVGGIADKRNASVDCAIFTADDTEHR
ncbi:MAG: hypothetical protein ACJAZO_002679 [Myxococcota bacterium]